jgi:hypothetical protein
MTEIIAFDPSHSWLKRWCKNGPLAIQAGWRTNPSGRVNKDNENPIVLSGGSKRWYGERACEGDHESPLNIRKDRCVRESFEAILQPGDNLKELTIIVSHWDEETSKKMADALLGSYSITRNGYTITTEVIRAIPILEGEGAYHLVQPRLKPGKTILFELGHGTTEEWVVAADGFFSGKGTENLAVSRLVETIAADENVRTRFIRLGEQEVNRELIARALRSGTLPNMDQTQWDLLKNKYIEAWFTSIKNYLLKRYGTELQTTANIVLSGGGAALVAERASKFAIIPPDPQFANVRGAFELYSKEPAHV